MTTDERRVYNREYYKAVTKEKRDGIAGQVSDAERADRKAIGYAWREGRASYSLNPRSDAYLGDQLNPPKTRENS